MLPYYKIKRMVLLAILSLTMLLAHAQKQQIKSVIFDTDMGPDYDDVGAIALLHAYADSGKINILATMASTQYEGVAAVLNVLNTYFKRPGIPIGVPQEKALTLKDWQHWTDTLIAKYPHTINGNAEVPGAVKLYRKILAAQPDNSVTIITVGFLTNISNLLQSKADEYSDLNGEELVNKKVKEMVSMAGKFPAGSEFNVKEDAAASIYAFEHFPKRILFSGFEIGEKIKCGLPLIQNTAIKNSPVKDVFRIAIPMAKEDSAGRMSWDQTAVMVAINGYEPYYTLQAGRITVNADGSNGWDKSGTGHAYLEEKMPFVQVRDLIDKWMMHQPK